MMKCNTLIVVWVEKAFKISSPNLSYDQYCTRDVDRAFLVETFNDISIGACWRFPAFKTAIPANTKVACFKNNFAIPVIDQEVL